MGTTPNLAIPYPELTDPADVPADVKKLAQRLDVIAAGALVTALPSSPVDGQEVYYQNAAMATLGVLWHLRYRTGATGSYKWEFAGGTPLYAERQADEGGALPAATFASLNANDPKVAVPLAGQYNAEHSATMRPRTVLSIVGCGLAVGATLPTNTTSPFETAGVNQYASMHQLQVVTATAGQTIAQMYYVADAQTVNVEARGVRVTPIRVG
jgi:hypothetical protein